MRKAQKAFDGIGVTNFLARFTGRILLEEEEADALVLDDTQVMVVVGSVGDGHFKINRQGDLERINVFKITDARLVKGELRKVLVEKLGLYGSDTLEPSELQLSFTYGSDGVDPKVSMKVPPEEEMDMAVLKPDGQNGQIQQVGRIGPPSGVANRFSDAVIPVGERIASIGTKDSSLKNFMDELV